MFKPNNQSELFGFETELSKKQRELLESSKEKWFYNLIYTNVNENYFKPLFSDKASRPNVAVNILVSALILKELKGISFDELMESMMFDLRFKAALGLTSLDNVPFSRGTIFNLGWVNSSKLCFERKMFSVNTSQLCCGVVYCAPSMGDNYRVQVPNTLGRRKC